ncbi:MAG: ABC transporter ATP-binding protein [Tissierella sp.]|nr:ABC transporter ATP-binding protein [Tissierella sp.]
MQKIINSIQLGEVSNIIFIYITVYVGIDLVQTIYNSIIGYYNSRFLMRFGLGFSEDIFRKASRLSLSDYENSVTYDLINRAQYEGGGKLIWYYTNFMSIITQSITLVSYLIILLSFRVWIVAVVLIMPIIRYFISNKFNLRRFKIVRERTNDSRKSWYISYLLTYGNFYKELKTFNLFDYFIDQYKSYIKRFNNEDLEITKAQTMIFSILSLVETIVNGLLFAYTVLLGVSGIILIGNIITYTRTIISSKSSITSILLNISSTINESLFIDQLFEYFNLEEEDNEGKIKINSIDNIRLKNVSYKYPNSKDYVLKNINLEINKDKKIALLGVNGSGKTTLIKIIMGFYSDYYGEILINGIDLKDIDKEDLLKGVSTLFQDFVKYEATFRENMGYSNFNIIDSDKKLYDISNKFNLTDIILKNERKLDTQLGTWFDDGINLSMGQWQKVALSRAFAKESDLYILDEPNAAMDSITEYEISQLYQEILKDKMGIIIAHKFSNIIKIVDEIIVLEEGKIIEQGSHDELMDKDEIYKILYELK